MSSLRTIRRRIKSVKNIRDITKAMQMISAVRFKRIETRFRKSLPYIHNLEQAISRILSEKLVEGNALFEKRDVKRELLVIMTGDRGLCGSFNTAILKAAETYFRENAGRDISVLMVGKVGAGYARRKGWKIYDTLIDIGYKFSADSQGALANKLVGAYLAKEFDVIQILSMKIIRAAVQRPGFDKFMNLSYLLESKGKAHVELDYIFEPSQKSVLDTLIDLYIRQRFFTALLSSVTAEYYARMIAMKMATDNGKEMLQELTLERNKIRQAMITKEISEIIGGVSALN